MYAVAAPIQAPFGGNKVFLAFIRATTTHAFRTR